jgi:hypothetical protein
LEQREADWAKAAALAKARLAIRTRLQLTGKSRDLALFNLAIDSKLGGCDVIALKAKDVAPAGYATDRGLYANERQADQSNSN